MKKFQIILMAVLMAAGMGYSALLSVDFSSDTLGSAPTATAVRPVIQSATGMVQVVTGSAIGSGNAVRYVDNSTEGVALEYNFVANSNVQQSAVSFSFTYSQRSTSATAGTLDVGIGEYSTSSSASLNAGTKRFGGFQVRNNGQIYSVFGGATTAIGTFNAGTVNTVDMYFNDFDAMSVSYTNGVTGYTLAANTFDLFVNGTRYSGALNTAALTDGGVNTVGTSQWNLGRIGLSSSTANAGLDVDFDNLVVNTLAIPEPATMGMLLLGAVMVLAVRRRRE